jgi:hypothetical protein
MANRLAGAILLFAVGILAGVASSRAAELLMFEDPTCSWCRRWHAEIGPSYPRSPEGQQAPLRRLHIREQATAGIALASPIRATPTFVLIEDGREVGRIVGYPGADFFYPRMAELLGMLPTPEPRFRPPTERSACLGPLRHS